MQLVLIPGDGIGPEVTEATCRVVAAAGAVIDWVVAPAGLDAVAKYGDPLPELTLDLIRKHRVALKGPCTTPVGKGQKLWVEEILTTPSSTALRMPGTSVILIPWLSSTHPKPKSAISRSIS